MKKIRLFFAFIIVNYTFCLAQKNIYVTTDQSQKIRNGSINSPFNNLNDVLNEVRKYNDTSNVNVNFLAGTYYLSNTITLNSNDGGLNGYKVTYQPKDLDSVVTISGGIQIPDSVWIKEDNANNIWACDLNFSNRFMDTFGIRYLYYNGMKCSRAKLYNYENGLCIEGDSTAEKYDYRSMDNMTTIIDNLQYPNEVELITHRTWQYNRNFINTVNVNDRSIILKSGKVVRKYNEVYKVLFLENAKEFIDEPYEWYYDKRNKRLYLKLAMNETPNNIIVTNPNIERLIMADGIHDIEFKNLKFSYSSWFAKKFNDYRQAYSPTDMLIQQACIYDDGTDLYYIPGSIEFNNSYNINFNNNKFEHLGAIGICFDSNDQNINIINNEFTDISAEAIRIGKIGNFNNKKYNIEDNHISNCANEYNSSVGIYVGWVNDVLIQKNTLTNLPYTGISIGMKWDTVTTDLGNIRVIGNKISNVVNKLSDGGAIYTLGANYSPSYIENNKISEIPEEYGKLRAGIYLDEGSTNWTVKKDTVPPMNLVDGMYVELFRHFSFSQGQNNYYDSNDLGKNTLWYDTKDREAFEMLCPYHLSSVGGQDDLGARFVDLNNDGYKDLIFKRLVSDGSIQEGVYINKGLYWENNTDFLLPSEAQYTFIDGTFDIGSKFVDLNNDGYEDYIYYSWSPVSIKKGAYKNTGNGWVDWPEYTPLHHLGGRNEGDLGARILDVDHDGFKDMIFYRMVADGTIQRGVILNNKGNGWIWSNDSKYLCPIPISEDGIKDLGVRFIDLNGDGYVDIVKAFYVNDSSYMNTDAYLNTINGWVQTPSYNPPFHISSDNYGDLGVRFVDVNNDGCKDMIVYRVLLNLTEQKHVYINDTINSTWIESFVPSYFPPIPTNTELKGDLGVKFVDINGDGKEDILKSYWYINNNIPSIETKTFINTQKMLYYPKKRVPLMRLQQTNDEKKLKTSNSNTFKAYPNPFINSIDIEFYCKNPAVTNIKIYDIRGTIVYKFNNGNFCKGNNKLNWNGCNNSGIEIDKGIYFVRVEDDGNNYLLKIIKK